ncbi:ABC transporter permease [Mycetocola tolaasinivorans]|uniref:ABC transporter permease n=1 Tax=Mycetocola tolaasinivorans TaxID=76635 RepID=UPI0016020213|nr:ABC transporter permease [Mycetocola tolaasinivorans]
MTTQISADQRSADQRAALAQAADRAARTAAALERFGVFIPFVIVAVLGIILAPNFLSAANIGNVLVNAAILAIVAYGMTLVIALRGLDLSVGSIQALSAVVCATAVNQMGILPGIVVGLIVGALVGLVNGVLIAYLKVPAFVATLGTMGIARGAALVFTDGGSVLVENKDFGLFASGKLLGIPYPFLLAIAILAVMYIVLERTPFGRHVCAVGGRPDAASESGINVSRVTVVSFVIVGVCAGLAGLLLTSQLGFVDGTLGTGLELQIIAIAVLGGTSMLGGSGNMPGSLVAAVLLAMIASSLNLLNIPSFYQYLAVGVLLLFALSLDTLRRRIQRNRLMGA